MNSKLKTLVAAVALSLGSTAAFAIPLDNVNGAANLKLNGLTTEAFLTAASNETTWGLGSITQISSLGGNWSAGEGGTYLYYMIYGIADLNIIGTRVAAGTGGPTTFDIFNIGATGGAADGKIHLDVYRSATQIPAIDQFFNADPGDRTGFDSHSLLAALGPAYLKLEFQPGKTTDKPAATDGLACGALDPFDTCETVLGTAESTATLVQTVDSTNLPASGSGTFFANVVGGTAAAKWDTGTQPNGYDFDANFTLRNNGAAFGTGTCTATQIAAGDCFVGYINDPATGSALPEPGTLALAGLALTGVAGLRRRKNK